MEERTKKANRGGSESKIDQVETLRPEAHIRDERKKTRLIATTRLLIPSGQSRIVNVFASATGFKGSNGISGPESET